MHWEQVGQLEGLLQSIGDLRVLIGKNCVIGSGEIFRKEQLASTNGGEPAWFNQ